MQKFLILITGWIGTLIAFVYLTFLLRQPSTAFWGLVQSEKTVIRAPEAGEISMLAVHPGDSVMAGDTLLVIFRPEVVRQQKEGQSRLQKLNAEFTEKLQQIRAQIARETHAREMDLLELEQERQIWEMELKRNQTLAKDWLSDSLTAIDSVVIQRRKEFETKQMAIKGKYQLRIDDLRQQASGLRPLQDISQDITLHDVSYWEAVSRQQVIRAPHDGWVGEVHVSEQEVTLKGTALVEIWGNQARYVEGFIHENFKATLTPGQKVKLNSANNADNKATATIIRLGNRIVEFPERLRKAPDVHLWGRETMIQLEEGNNFLIGEKVLIQVQKP